MVDQLLRHMGCDRCGNAWTGPHTVSPEGWVTLNTQSTRGSEHFHICEECDVDLARFLQNWEVARGDL